MHVSIHTFKVATQYADLTRELFEALLSLDDGFAEPGEVTLVPLAKLRSKGEDAATYTLSGEDPGGFEIQKTLKQVFFKDL